MAKHAKTLQRLYLSPTPTDITWDEIKALLKHLGFEEKRNSGSRRKFFHPVTLELISLHSPHPGSQLKQYAVRELADQLIHHRNQ